MASKAGQQLHDLIHSMSKAEKRHFKMSCGQALKSNDRSYLTLFDAIAKQTFYNEAKIKSQFSKFPFAQKLPQSNYFLSRQILKTLRNLNDSKNLQSLIYANLESIEDLYGRCLYEQAYNLLTKTKRLVSENELWKVLLDVLDWESKLYPHIGSADSDWYLELDEQEQSAMAKLRLEMSCRQFWNIGNAIRQLPQEQQLEEWKQHSADSPLMLSIGANTFLSKLLSGLIRTMYHLSSLNKEAALVSIEGVGQHWKENTGLINMYPSFFMSTVDLHLEVLIYTASKSNTIDFYIDVLSLLDSKSARQQNKLALYSATLHLKYLLADSFWEKKNALSSDFRQQLNASSELMQVDKKLESYFLLVVYNFSRQDYYQTISSIEQLRSLPKHEVPIKIQGYILYFELLAYYKTGRDKAMENCLRTLYRYNRVHNKEVVFGPFVFDYVKASIKFSKSKEKEAWLHSFSQQLDECEERLDLYYYLTLQLLGEWASKENKQRFSAKVI